MAFAQRSITAGTSPGSDPIKVMVVDDAVVIRGLLTRWLGEDKSLKVVSSHRNGKLAVEDIEKSNPDVVVLDIEMPEMDGMTALPLMLAKKRDLVVIMASTLTRRNAEISLKALSLGAADYVPKPESTSEVTTSIDFRRELIEKVKALGARAIRMRGPARTMRAETSAGRTAQPVRPVSVRPATDTRATFRGAAQPAGAAAGAVKYQTRPYSSARPRILAIGSSTGGPQALQEVMREVGTAMNDVPVVITQHMPPTFTAILAEHMGKAALRPSKEGEDGEVLKPGNIYVAPGGKHMIIEKDGGVAKIRLTDGPPVNFCKPAVDPLFDSVAKVFGSASLAVILTGMGHDGAEGVKTIAAGGGSVITQDEATSVVWGMPGAAAQTGVCSEILPLKEIGPKISRVLKGNTR
ncbi:protein-glutamate methylesterase/protein-glutamine glutaminase [Roseibium aggregatum]|jgi:two-component system chemotaxis response regulator CheB|uniref:Protein-glutamate methylesterase/protein-glutamine glutaminase n=1 Tax=Roseibium aggregatum (strain ATCC 25650 / DSM 13394 / JCM 20685 / NBRC 16684 / NCIMB 2208 / IAM 12614 / B1) TaxID=384765 RepID=A0NNA5_ROSAI|nr:chemotaxis response regulator protein-glutamate methylesterase [Roseibium aggregatum]EAV45636.1 chemotaxis-specific methylesterase [Stappia aggregata IAM 12614] [Roseibium aggregatum IAM 12614]